MATDRGAPIAFQAILFVLTGWKFYQAVRSGWGDVPLMLLLMRDGTWAFFALFGEGQGSFIIAHDLTSNSAVLLGEGILYGAAPDAYSGVLFGSVRS